MRFPRNVYQGQWQFPFSHMLRYFRAALFLKKLLIHSFSKQLFSKYHESYFFGAVLSSGQQHFLRSSFFRTVTFSQHFFFFFSEYLLVQSETSTQKPNLENRKFFSAVTSQNIYKQKISTEELYFRTRFFRTIPTFSKKARFWKKLLFQKSKIQHYLLFLES